MINGKIQYAVLGLGIGMAHADAAAESENADLRAVCDIDTARLDELHKIHPEAALYTDFGKMLEDKEIDIVSICVPSGMHAEFAIRAMEAGKNVLIEKPVDITPERAERIIEARDRTGMIAGVVHQNRFNLNMTEIKKAIDEGRLGRLLLGTFAVKWYRDQKYYDRGGWRGTWEMDGGGSLMNQAVHTVDLMQWFMGDVESVTSQAAIMNHNIKTEDITTSIVKFKSGAMATFVSTTCAYPGISTEICLYGTDGSIEADADTLKVWKMKNSDDEDAEEERMLSLYGHGNRTAAELSEGVIYGHRRVVEDMISAVKNHQNPPVLPEDAVKSVKIVNAVYASAKTGKTICIN